MDMRFILSVFVLSMAIALVYTEELKTFNRLAVKETTSRKPPTTTTSTTRPPKRTCVADRENGCRNLRDGDYPACNPLCQKGVYFSCSGGYTYLRDCAEGWYFNSKGEAILAKLVYNPGSNSCERTSRDCPRYLDDFVAG